MRRSPGRRRRSRRWRALAPADRARTAAARWPTRSTPHGVPGAGSRRATPASRSPTPAARWTWSWTGVPLLRRGAGAAARRHDPGRRRPGVHGPRAARRRRADRAVELPARDRGLEARPGARGRQHGRAQAGRADAPDRAAVRIVRGRSRASPRASSTSSSARAASAGSGWSSIPTSRRSRSPARPRSAARSRPAPPARSSA